MLEFHAEVPQATASEGRAQGSYMAARAGFEPACLNCLFIYAALCEREEVTRIMSSFWITKRHCIIVPSCYPILCISKGCNEVLTDGEPHKTAFIYWLTNALMLDFNII